MGNQAAPSSEAALLHHRPHHTQSCPWAGGRGDSEDRDPALPRKLDLSPLGSRHNTVPLRLPSHFTDKETGAPRGIGPHCPHLTAELGWRGGCTFIPYYATSPHTPLGPYTLPPPSAEPRHQQNTPGTRSPPTHFSDTAPNPGNLSDPPPVTFCHQPAAGASPGPAWTKKSMAVDGDPAGWEESILVKRDWKNDESHVTCHPPYPSCT